MPLQATSGAASYDAFGGGVAVVPNYIEDVFSTWLYTGNDSTTTINNGIDVSGKGGLVWVKARANGNRSHTLFDSATYTTGQYYLASNLTNAFLDTGTPGTFAFNSNGFSVTGTSAQWNASGQSFVGWTFRKQPKFFDVVTYTGNGGTNLISHNLGSAPGCIIVKNLSTTQAWGVWHRGNGGTTDVTGLSLNTTTAAQNPDFGQIASFTSTTWPAGYVYANSGNMNNSGETYVAYLFAHNAGGFGLTGTDNVISCGSFTTGAGGSASVNIGFEPQYLLVKCSSAAQNWRVFDTMRGFSMTTNVELYPNTSDSDQVYSVNRINPTATGFEAGQVSASPFFASQTYIYIAIRRGPMKVPTDATKVYYAYQPHSTGATISVGFPTDFLLTKQYNGTSGWGAGDRLRGNDAYLIPNNTSAEGSFANTWGFTQAQNTTYVNYNGANSISYFYRRAPSFFDEVCYTGTGSATTQTHNLGVAPELMIVKRRNAARYWAVYAAPLGATKWLELETQDAVQTDTMWNNTAPTSSVFSIGTYNGVNGSGDTYVAYLFSTCAGVSKVGSYTGNGSTQTINCGFASGARFVLIKRYDSTGNWYVYDTARGMTVLTDPYILLNTADAESATLGSVTTVSTGFALDSTILAAINVSGGTYIFLAIA